MVRIHLLPLKPDLFGLFLSGSSSVGRASAFQAEGRGFEPRLPLPSGSLGDFDSEAFFFIFRITYGGQKQQISVLKL